MNLSLATYFILYILYSFLGWCMEVVVIYISTKKLVDRGFLIGPICPIYGWGCLFIILLLNKYLEDPLVLFVMSVLICSILEYFTSYIMEKLFKARWWDYSDRKYNINGRICLDNLVAFGLLGLLMMYFINPFFVNILGKVNSIILNSIAICVFIIYLIDNIVSLNIISSFKKAASTIKKDSTEEITKRVREILIKRGGLYKRLVSAFNFEASERLLKDFTTRVRNETRKARKKLKLESKKQKEKIKMEELKAKEKIKLEKSKINNKINDLKKQSREVKKQIKRDLKKEEDNIKKK